MSVNYKLNTLPGTWKFINTSHLGMWFLNETECHHWFWSGYSVLFHRPWFSDEVAHSQHDFLQQAYTGWGISNYSQFFSNSYPLTCPRQFILTSRMSLQTTSYFSQNSWGKVLSSQSHNWHLRCHPVKVPPHPIPFHYVEKVHGQLWEMAQEGIIRPKNNSPWCSPADFFPKSNGEIHICIDLFNWIMLPKRTPILFPELRDPPQDMHAEYDVTSQPEMSIQEIRTVSNHGQESSHTKDLCKHA